MFERKKLWLMLATTALVAACGGGSGGGTPSSDTTNPPSSGSSPGDTNNPPAAQDQTLTGFLELKANQLIIGEGPVSRTAFEEDRVFGRATGGVGAEAAPVSAFGFRVGTNVIDFAPNETARGRFALSLVEREGTAGIGASESAETMRILLDQVDLSTDANGVLSANVPSTASLQIVATARDGTSITETITNLPADAVSLTPVDPADPTSVGLALDLNSAFGAATDGQRATLQPMEVIRGVFDTGATLSAARIFTAATGGTELVGPSITVGNTAPVTGAGVEGRLDIRMD